jgi:type II secretory pathway pseudopilin PulG
MLSPHATLKARPRTAAAFSLIEMLVVLLILTVIIAIVVPTIQSFRNTSRKAVTRDIMASVATSIGQFRLSQNRLPGYFSASEMGGNANDMNRYFTGMENLMLDLAGGLTQDPESAYNPATVCDPVSGPGVITVGPSNTNQVRVKIGRIGAADGGSAGEVVRGYYKPDPKYFVRQCQPNRRAGNMGAHWAMPVLVDPWGTPILAWVQDSVPATGFPLVSDTSATRARFYYRSNVGFTQARALGKLGRDQTADSMLGIDPSTIGAPSVAGVVGNPAFAGEPRAPVVMHSAGFDGVYLGKDERGVRSRGLLGSDGRPTSPLPATVGRDYFEEGDFNDVIGKAE